MAHECNRLGLHDSILLHVDGASTPIETTVGRVIFNQVVPHELEFTDLKTEQRIRFINQEVRSKDLSRLVSYCFNELGNSRTVEFLDELKRVAFHYATYSGLSIGMDDLIIPEAKETLIAEARKKVDAIEKEYRRGGMSEGERYNQVIDVWHQLIQSVEASLFDSLEEGRDDEIRGFNPVHVMADSGARSKKEPIRQISGMRGLMTKPSGAIIEQPIESCFREGLSVLEYFISTHGARKGLADTAIKTASSGYLTRKLVDVAQDVMITMTDCGTLNGITKIAGETEDDTLAERIHGRTASEDIVNPNDDTVIVARDSLINPLTAEKIEAVGITEARVRSALTCEAPHGVCSKCYGADLTTGQFIDIGEAVGIIGAQSIGEPGTQLTMRTFHTGGTVTAGDFQFQSRIEARHDGRVKYEKIEVVERKAPDSEVTERVVLSRNGQLLIVDENGRVVERHQVPIGATLCVEDGAMATKGNPDTNDPPPTLLLERDPYRVPILTEHNGVVVFQDIIEGHTVQEDKASGLAERVIVEYKGEDQPRMEIRTPDDDVLASYLMPTGAHLSVTDGEEVEAGTVLARLPEKSATSQDIVTGLPRVTELLEARRPKDRAIIAEIEGYVEFDHRISRGMRQLRIKHGDESSALYRIPVGKHLVVHENDWVDAGRPPDGRFS